MYLKLMGKENMPDSEIRKPCIIVGNVAQVNYYTLDTRQRVIDVTYSEPNKGSMSETFVLIGNAYLLNDEGKTINAFAVD